MLAPNPLLRLNASQDLRSQQSTRDVFPTTTNPKRRTFHSSGASENLSAWVQDVIQSKSLRPRNPLMTGVRSHGEEAPVAQAPLPEFRRMLPHHLESAAHDAAHQYRVQLAELEVELTGGTPPAAPTSDDTVGELGRLLDRLDALEAPLLQVFRVGRLYHDLAATPDRQEAWTEALEKIRERTLAPSRVPWRESKVVYQRLVQLASEEGSDGAPVGAASPSLAALLLEYQKHGAHLPLTTGSNDDSSEESTNEERTEELQGLEAELKQIRSRLHALPSEQSLLSKNQQLQMVSDLYNWLGYSKLQGSRLSEDASARPNWFSSSMSSPTYSGQRQRTLAALPDTEAVALDLGPRAAELLKAYLPKPKASLDAEVAGMLGGGNKDANIPAGPSSEEERLLFKSKWKVQKIFFLHGVLQGIGDFWDAMFGIRLEKAAGEAAEGWNPSVTVFRLYEADTDEPLGTIYLDGFKDSYWKTEEAQDLTTAFSFTGARHQTSLPVAVVALGIEPTWDDAPTPLTWDNTRDLLYQMGKALQLVLANHHLHSGVAMISSLSDARGSRGSGEEDISEVLGTVRR